MGYTTFSNVKLGEKVIISDPCYDHTGGVIVHVKEGEYTPYVMLNNGTVDGLAVFHKDYVVLDDTPSELRRWADRNYVTYTKCNEGIDVDSGQAGVYDLDEFLAHETEREFTDLSGWYRKNCNLTLEGYGGTINGKGAVSSSGDGDGCYDLYLFFEKQGKIIGMLVDFATEVDEDDYWDNDEDEEYEEYDEEDEE